MQITNNNEHLKQKKELNADFWDNEKLKPEIRRSLLEVSKKYKDFINLDDIKVLDVVLTGSITNINYTKNSDVDLHLVIDYKKLKTPHDILLKMFIDKKNIWASKYKITIHNHPLEIFMQDFNEKNTWSNFYSVTKNKWIQRIEPEEIEKDEVKEKTTEITDKLDKLFEKEPNEKTIDEISKILSDIADKRVETLHKDSNEFSTDNLVYKIIRDKGYFQKKDKLKQDFYKEKYSINENISMVIPESVYNKIKEIYIKTI